MQKFKNAVSFKVCNGNYLFDSMKINYENNNNVAFPFNIGIEKDSSQRIINDLTREYNNIVPDYTAHIFKDPGSIIEIR